MGGRGSSGGSSSSTDYTDQYNKTVRAMSILRQDIKKFNDIANGRAYYPESVKEKARMELERSQTAYDVLSAKLDLIEAQRRKEQRQREAAEERRKKKKKEQKSSSGKVIDLFAYRKK